MSKIAADVMLGAGACVLTWALVGTTAIHVERISQSQSHGQSQGSAKIPPVANALRVGVVVNANTPDSTDTATITNTTVLPTASETEMVNGAVVDAIVDRVVDGDTIKLMDGRRVRLANIDAPESEQDGGDGSTWHLKLFLRNGNGVKLLTVQESDRYGRLVAEVYLPDGQDLNVEQVRSGEAWCYREYAKDVGYWVGLEQEAQAGKRGIWANGVDGVVPPWEWRREHRQGGYRSDGHGKYGGHS